MSFKHSQSKNVCSLLKMKNVCVKCVHSIRDPPSVCVCRHVICKWTRLSPLFLHTASDPKLDSGKAWERSYLVPSVPLRSSSKGNKFNWTQFSNLLLTSYPLSGGVLISWEFCGCFNIRPTVWRRDPASCTRLGTRKIHRSSRWVEPQREIADLILCVVPGVEC